MKFYEVSKRDMFTWIEYVELEAGGKEKKSARTINKYLATIGSFYNFFEGMGGYIENPIKTTQTQTNRYWTTFNVTKDQVSINFFRWKETKKQNTTRLCQNEIDSGYECIADISMYERG